MLLGLLCLSKRIHSIYVLRLFNDGVCMLLLYAAVLLFTYRHWRSGCALFAAAFSVKMNIALFIPALAGLLLADLGFLGALPCVFLCGAITVAVGVPFLLTDWRAYLNGSFDLTRVFSHRWSVNFKWVPCAPLPAGQETLLQDCAGLFTSKQFSLGMLLLHLSLLAAFTALFYGWYQRRQRRAGGGGDGKKGREAAAGATLLSNNQQVTILFTANFVGVACSRSLHFQFYVWYYHTLPFLLWSTRLPFVLKLALLAGIEAAWNPWVGDTSTPESSLLLTVCHAVSVLALLHGVWKEKGGGADEALKKTS